MVISMQKFKDGLIGLAIGDAMGLPVINMSRDILLTNPITEMVGGGEYNCLKGTWSIPTELTLAVRESLEKHGYLDKQSIMHRLIDVDNDVYAIEKDTFSLGNTTKKAIEKNKSGSDLDSCGNIDLNENGSGALLMMYPVAYYAYQNKLKETDVYELVKDITSITHNHEINIIGCYIYTMYLLFLLRGKDKYASLSMLQCCDFSYFEEEYLDLYSRILKTSLKDISIDNIVTNGYIVSSLESALYVLLNSENYSQSILGAINLGGKTNITSSLVGCMAGIIYTENDIPDDWLRSLRGKDILDKFM